MNYKLLPVIRCLLFSLLCLIASPLALRAQAPPNDECRNAAHIDLANGYTDGTFQSPKVNLKNATRDMNEWFDELHYYMGNDKKSVWYEFEIPVRRSITLALRQRDSGIVQIRAGFSVFRTENCKIKPDMMSEDLVSVSQFGEVWAGCLSEGKYRIQICAGQQANDSIWLDVTSAPPASAAYDRAATPLNIGKLDGVDEKTLDLSCLSLDSAGEICPGMPKDFSKTAWLTFNVTKAGYHALRTTTYGSCSITDTPVMSMQLYEGNIKNGYDQVKLIESCTRLQGDKFYGFQERSWPCMLTPSKEYSIQLFIREKFNCTVKAQLVKINKASGKELLPQTAETIILDSTAKPKIKFYMGCDNIMRPDRCGTLGMSSFSYPRQIQDSVYQFSYDMAAWTILDVKEQGTAYINIETTDTLSYSRSYASYVLFKGDIRTNCNLKPWRIIPENKAWDHTCLDPGIYSVMILGQTKKQFLSDDDINSSIGSKFELSITFHPKRAPIPGINSRPWTAQNLGDITNRSSFYSTPSYFNSPDTTVVIDGIKCNDRLLFYEFYVSKDTRLAISNKNLRPYLLIFKGQGSKGLQSLKVLNYEYSFKTHIWDTAQFRSGCKPLGPGWYTMVYFMEKPDSCGRSINIPFVASFNKITHPALAYDRPYNAALINNGQPLDYGPDRYYKGFRETWKAYTLPKTVGCSPAPTSQVATAGKCKNEAENVTYYVFTIRKECSLHNPHIHKSVLYDFDIGKDSSLLKDTTRIVRYCDQSGIFVCKLQPGTYSLAVFRTISDTATLQLVVDRCDASPFDHASNAADLGFLQNNIAKTGPSDYMSCANTSHKTDPTHLWQEISDHYNAIPDVPANNVSNYSFIRNTWQSFTCAGAGTIQVKRRNTIDPLNDYRYGTSFRTRVVKSNIAPWLSISDLKAQKLGDSTEQQGLQSDEMLYKSQLNDSIIQFHKYDCDSTRYYIITESIGPTTFGIRYEVTFIPFPTTLSHDYCAGAKQLGVPNFGTYTTSAYATCHSTSSDFGEDGSNMGCLKSDYPLKTTWFKVNYTGKDKADLSFKVYYKYNPYKTLPHRVLYGSCDAMTAAYCSKGQTSVVTLSCAGKGEYYIQVATPLSPVVNNLQTEIEVQVKAEPTFNKSCKPIPLHLPVANFSAEGGCNATPVRFRNFSTAGSAVKYFWDFGDGTGSTDKEPSHIFHGQDSLDTFQVRLIVLNTLNSMRDTLILPVYIFSAPITLDLGLDTMVRCNTPISVIPRTNFPDARLEWFSQYYNLKKYADKQNFPAYQDGWLAVRMTAGNCVFTDTLRIKIDMTIAITGKREICPGDSTLLIAPSHYSNYQWISGNTNKPGKQIWVSKPGTYRLMAFDSKRGCSDYDSVTVTALPASRLLCARDTFLCNGDSVRMNRAMTNTSYRWSTGDTTATVFIRQPGIYRVTMDNGMCRVNDSIIVRPMRVDLGPDTSVCPGTSIVLNASIPNGKYLWSTEQRMEAILVTKPGEYWVKAESGTCTVTDTIRISALPVPKIRLSGDTVLCDSFNFTLDAGPGVKYTWQPGGHTGRTLEVSRHGLYKVWVENEHGCTATDSILLSDRCEPTLFVPNAFTPSADTLNDVFRPVGTYINEYEMTIFDRWGERVFRTTDLNIGWDGRIHGRPAPAGVYVYIVRYAGLHARKEAKGTLHLLR